MSTSAGGPSATTRPSATTTTRSAWAAARPRSWSTTTAAARRRPTRPRRSGQHQLLVVDVERGGGLVEQEQLGAAAPAPGRGRPGPAPRRTAWGSDGPRRWATSAVGQRRRPPPPRRRPPRRCPPTGCGPCATTSSTRNGKPSCDLLGQHGPAPGQLAAAVHVVERRAVDAHRARVARHVAGQGGEERRLAGPVRPDEGDQLARPHLEVDVGRAPAVPPRCDAEAPAATTSTVAGGRRSGTVPARDETRTASRSVARSARPVARALTPSPPGGPGCGAAARRRTGCPRAR